MKIIRALAIILACLPAAAQAAAPPNVVFIVADDGWKYLSSGIYTLPVDEIENLDSTVWW